jgi:ComF family protein
VRTDTWALYSFENPLVRELLHTLKYNGVDEIARLLMETVKDWQDRGELLGLLGGNVVIVPVPTSRATIKGRGYNQAELLARALGEWLNIPVATNLLTKVKKTTSVGKSGMQRRITRQLFEWSGGEREERQIILVDDVYTTGSTVAACRNVIEAHTEQSVKVIVAAVKHG